MMTTQTFRISSLISTVAAALLMGVAPVNARADNAIVAPGNGINVGIEWWQNAVSFPSGPGNPVQDESGAVCGHGQRGDTWFLYGSFGNPDGPLTRECTVPTDTAFLVPVVNVVCTPWRGETVEQNIAICKDYIDNVDSMVLTVDGSDRGDLIRRYPARAKDVFTIVFPEGNFIGYPAGVYKNVTDGYYATVPPLAAGPHTIHVQGSVTAYGFVLDVIYHLTVVEPGVVNLP